MPRFIDEVKIRVKAGDGGNGCMSFFRGPHLPKGGPDGGDGGKGGDVYFEASTHLQSLLDFKYQPLYRAERAQDGRGKSCHGRGGEDLVVKVPPGTLIKNSDGEILWDLTQIGEQILVARGGSGGKGNVHFKSSTNQAPRQFTKGELGEELELHLELRSLCDVGLVGFPNAGKSQLLRALTQAKPKVADYPFTTLSPQLGIYRSARMTLSVADIPGLIHGAHENRGLGHQFLRHISRSKVLLILLALDSEQGLQKDFEDLLSELKAYEPSLLKKERLLVVNKADLLPTNLEIEKEWKRFVKKQPEALLISAEQGSGLTDLTHRIEQELLPPPQAMIS